MHYKACNVLAFLLAQLWERRGAFVATLVSQFLFHGNI